MHRTSLLIAGAQKSCSTSLAVLLGRHPRISMMRRESAAFEDPHYPSNIDQISNHVDTSLAAQTVPALKRPELLHCSEASGRAQHHLPDPVVVVVLREPIARTISAYYHYVSYGLLPAVSPDQGIVALLDRLSHSDMPSVGDEVIHFSQYADSIRRLRRQFGDRLLVFYQEVMLADTRACTDTILKALSLDPRDLGTLPRSNTGHYSLRPLQLSRLGGQIGYDIDNERARFIVTQKRIRRHTAQGLFALHRLRPRIQSPPQPVLSGTVRQQLVELLSDDAQQLPELVQEPLPNTWISSLQLESPYTP